MRNQWCFRVATVVIMMAGGPVGVVEGETGSDATIEEQTRVDALCRQAQPVAAALFGVPEGGPVPVVVRSRAEVRDYLLEVMDREYPNRELQRRSSCFAEIGLVPRGYDLAGGLAAAVDQAAGGLYDPHSKVFISISDLSEELKSAPYQRLIAGHELTHALQDRKVDLVARGLEVLEDLDAGYGFVAVVEGTAMVVGMAHMQNVALDEMSELAAVLRAGFEAQYSGDSTLADAPPYLRERLIGPYVDGSAFVQMFLNRNPGRPLASLFDDLPVSAEQVLHYEKYVEGDEPTPVDLRPMDDLRPEAWRLIYTNTLGEFELRTLFASHAATRDDAVSTAAGWDGFRLAAYGTDDGTVIVAGASVWDSVEDASEFSAAFAKVLAGLHARGSYEIRTVGNRVGFVTGVSEDNDRSTFLDALVERPEPGGETDVPS